MAGVWVRQVSTPQPRQEGMAAIPCSSPSVTQNSPTGDPKQPQEGWHSPCETTALPRPMASPQDDEEQVALTAAPAGTCRALTCTARFCILTPSLGMSPVSLGAVSAPKPPEKH